ncbi:MAG TPA: hypothetical protein VNC61_07090 [Acidimicrobiales bacterium]|nr:hypothetical protein [Acidimicrobiales bacterium]
MPDGQGERRRAAFSKRFLAGVAVGVVLAGIGVGVGVGVTSGHSTPTTTAPARAPGIDMSRATGFACGAPVPPGPGHPQTLLSQVFNASGAGGTAYIVGWQIVPFRGTRRSYQFGVPGNLLALQPATGGPPLGYGKGTVTYGPSTDAGTINAVVTLKTGKAVTLQGLWHCVATPGTTTTLTTPTTAPIQGSPVVN